jgi:hypothetical protein
MSKKVKNDPDNYSKMSLPHESEEAANNRLRLCAVGEIEAQMFVSAQKPN